MESDAGNCSVLCCLTSFDTVDHSILLNRLRCLAGVSGSALEWLSSYLSDRRFSVSTNKFSSTAAVFPKARSWVHYYFLSICSPLQLLFGLLSTFLIISMLTISRYIFPLNPISLTGYSSWSSVLHA